MSESPLVLVAVTNYSNVVDAASDSDEEDKLHIVEEDGGECDGILPEDEHRGGLWDGGKSLKMTKKRQKQGTRGRAGRLTRLMLFRSVFLQLASPRTASRG